MPDVPGREPERPAADDETGLPVTIDLVRRKLRMHSVTEEELATLRAVVPATSIGFLGIAVGAALTFWSVLKATGLSPQVRGDFNALYFASRVMTAFFAIVAVTGYVRLFGLVRHIKRRPEPLGAGDGGPPRQIAAKAGLLEITHAVYGEGHGAWPDVTPQVIALVKNNALDFVVANPTLVANDPSPGKLKTLTIRFSVDGQPYSKSWDEGERAQVP